MFWMHFPRVLVGYKELSDTKEPTHLGLYLGCFVIYIMYNIESYEVNNNKCFIVCVVV